MGGARGPFARAFVPWVAEWQRAGLSGTQERVLLLLISRMEEQGDGSFTTWYPRAEISATLGISPNTARNAIRGLRGKGIIERIKDAGRRACPHYRIMPVEKGTRSAPPFAEKGTRSAPPFLPAETHRLRSSEGEQKGYPLSTPSKKEIRERLKAVPSRAHSFADLMAMREGGVLDDYDA